MNKNLYNKLNRIRICKGNTCVEASGQNAKTIVLALTFVFVCMGIAALIKS